jgi:hypothetical protein
MENETVNRITSNVIKTTSVYNVTTVSTDHCHHIGDITVVHDDNYYQEETTTLPNGIVGITTMLLQIPMKMMVLQMMLIMMRIIVV